MLYLLITSTLFFGFSQNLRSQTHPDRMPINILVEGINDPNLSRFGIDENRIRTDIELKLLQYGVKVSHISDRTIYVNINTLEIDNQPLMIAANIEVEYWENMIPENELPRILRKSFPSPDEASKYFGKNGLEWPPYTELKKAHDTTRYLIPRPATAWQNGGLVLLGESKISTIRERIKDFIDDFLAYFLKK